MTLTKISLYCILNHTTYEENSEIDLTQGEIKYVKEKFDVSESNLQREEKN